MLPPPPPVSFRVLLQCRVDVDSRDVDGWTPLHAAAHWGQEEVCSLLADHLCDMGAVNNVVSEGQTLDLALTLVVPQLTVRLDCPCRAKHL